MAIRIRHALRYAFAMGCAGLAAHVYAQQASDWPSKPVRFMVPFPPGGSVDPLARLTGARLNAALGQQFVVDNRAGASGAIGTAIAAKSTPDGYTYVFVFDTHAVNPALISDLSYDTLKDFASVMVVGTAPMVLTTNPSKPYKSFDDVLKLAKAKPATLTFGSVGSGSLGHLAMMLVQQQAGMKMIHIPYKGGGPATTDAIGGQIDFAVTSVAVPGPHIRAGRLRAVVTTGEKRSHMNPDTPTLIESGLPGLSALAWWGIVTPAGLPRPLLNKVHGELVKVYNQPELRKQLTEQFGMDLVVGTPEAMTKFLVAEMARWSKGSQGKQHSFRLTHYQAIMNIERGLVKTGLGYMHYRAAGNVGSGAIFLQHINQQSSALYLELMAVLCPTLRVVAMDYPSHGASDHVEAQPTIGDYARCVTEVADALGIHKFSVLGEAVGAAVSIELAANHAQHVNKAVLVNCPYYKDRSGAEARHAPLKGGLRPEDASGFPLTRTIDFLLNNDPGHAPMRPTQSWMDRVNTAQIDAGRHRWQALDALHQYDISVNLQRMQCPTLLLIGEHFHYLQYRDEFHNKNKYLRSEVLPGARFCMGWERAAEVGRHTLEFLKAPA